MIGTTSNIGLAPIVFMVEILILLTGSLRFVEVSHNVSPPFSPKSVYR